MKQGIAVWISNKKTMNIKYILELYIHAESSSSQLAKSNLESILKYLPKKHYQLKIIDVSHHPEICERKKLVVLPVLIKVKPAPKQIFFGTLENDKVLAAMLGVTEKVQVRTDVRMLKKKRVGIPLIFEEKLDSKILRDVIIGKKKKSLT